jgi:hypothetical protein
VESFLHSLVLSGPLFLLVGVGYAVMKLFRLPVSVSKLVTKVVFTVFLPALLFPMMAGLRSLPPPDFRVLAAFFGGCLLVFALGRLGGRALGLDGAGRSVFGIGGVFSNNVMLGLPLARMVLGPESVPTVALVLVFNALFLWSLVTVAVEWSRHGGASWKALGRTAARVAINPIVAAIMAGVAFGFTGWTLPEVVGVPLHWLGEAAGPLALLSLGMGLAEFGLGKDRRITAALTSLKLVAHPLAVWALAAALGLPSLETRTLVLLSSIAIGANVYLMARQFGVMEAPVAQSLLVSTLLSALTTPLLLALVP